METKVSHSGPEDKMRLRRTQEMLLKTMDRNTQVREAAYLVDFLESWAWSRGFEAILATLPLPDEPDLTPFLASWLTGGRKVALARTSPGRTLGFRYIDSLEGPWDHRPFGLKEPHLTAPAWVAGPATLCLVPGLAFAPASPQGAVRLGRGGGYYDRWLEAHGQSVFTLGVGFSVQTVAQVPREAHDRILDAWWNGIELKS